MRQIIALVLGAGMMAGGLWLLYNLFFEAERIPLMFVAGGGFATFIGAFLLWDTLRNWDRPPTSDD